MNILFRVRCCLGELNGGKTISIRLNSSFYERQNCAILRFTRINCQQFNPIFNILFHHWHFLFIRLRVCDLSISGSSNLNKKKQKLLDPMKMQGRELERWKSSSSSSFHLWEYAMSLRHRFNHKFYVSINSFNCGIMNFFLKILPILSIVIIWFSKNFSRSPFLVMTRLFLQSLPTVAATYCANSDFTYVL